MNLQIEPYAHLRAAFAAGCRIQAWHLNDGAANSNEGRWDTLTPPEGREPEFGCALHLYRVHPDDEAKALSVWNVRMPTAHLPQDVRHYIERLVSNTNPAYLVRDNELLRDEVKRLAALLAEHDGGGALALIAAERRRHVDVEGWTQENDDQHVNGAMADAAGCYALSAGGVPEELFESLWPWARNWWKPSPGNPIRSLVKAGSLIVAEIERQQRAAATRPITVWQINDMEWFVGAGTPESILTWYMEEHGLSHEEATGDEDELPRALSDHELDTLKFRDCDENERPTGIVRTFREQLAIEIAEGGTFPRLFASTEC
jgi:hypothetical protein